MNEQVPPPASPAPRRSRRWVLAFGALAVLGMAAGAILRGTTATSGAKAGTNRDTTQPAPAAQAEEEAGRLRIESDPPGASLFVNGHLLGSTPLTLHRVAPGAYGLRLELAGHEPLTRRVLMGEKALHVREKLEPCATGELVVDIQPRGAEVLLGGELAGITPLRLEKAPAGQHELLIRKTNCKPFSQRIEIRPGEPVVFKGFGLEDMIMKMLEGLVANEPQRVAHYIDLAHYQFVADRLEDSVETFIRAEETGNQPLEFFEEMGPEERALEMRLRGEDIRRLKKEIQKHREPKYFGLAKTREFAQLYEDALLAHRNRNIGAWTWVESAARDFTQQGDYHRAEQLYLGHLEKASDGPSVLPCTLALLKVRVMKRDFEKIAETMGRLVPLIEERPALLFEAGKAIASVKDRIRPDRREGLLKLAEDALRRACTSTEHGLLRAETSFELAQVLTAQDRPGDAIPFYLASLKGDLPEETTEERVLCLAEAYLQAGKYREAKTLLDDMVESENVVTREKARAKMLRLQIKQD